MTVRGGGVHVQVAADVVGLDQRRQFARVGPPELLSIFTQFRRDPRKSDRFVNALLGVPGNAALIVLAEYAVLVDLQAQSGGHRTGADVVSLRSGEVLQRGTELL